MSQLQVNTSKFNYYERHVRIDSFLFFILTIIWLHIIFLIVDFVLAIHKAWTTCMYVSCINAIVYLNVCITYVVRILQEYIIKAQNTFSWKFGEQAGKDFKFTNPSYLASQQVYNGYIYIYMFFAEWQLAQFYSSEVARPVQLSWNDGIPNFTVEVIL